MSVEVVMRSLLEFPTTLSLEYFKLKLRSCWCKCFRIINDLNNVAKILNLSFVVLEI